MNSVLNKYYKIADLGLRVSMPQEWSPDEGGILQDFISSEEQFEYSVVIDVVDQLSPPKGELVYTELSKSIYNYNTEYIRYDGYVSDGWESAYMRICNSERYKSVQIKRSSVPNKIESKILARSMELEHVLALNQGIILHASYIEYQGKAILFTAPSGTGKSTQAELWGKYYKAKLINGDRAAIRVLDDGIYVWGVPFSGMSFVTQNIKLPLAAIVYLTQSPINSVLQLLGAKAFRRIWEGCSINVWYDEDIQNCSQTVTEIVNQVPIVFLGCTPDKRAVDILHHELERLDRI